jgi:drug/metabolite transporter (DMT)-like permease
MRCTREEIIAGAATGLLIAALLPLTQLALQYLKPEVVFPVTVVSPAILTLLMGHVIFRERLSKTCWAASLAGVAGIAVLSIWAR